MYAVDVYVFVKTTGKEFKFKFTSLPGSIEKAHGRKEGFGRGEGRERIEISACRQPSFCPVESSVNKREKKERNVTRSESDEIRRWQVCCRLGG